MLGVAADVKTIGEGDECERGQLTNFGAPRVVSISISLNAPVSLLSMIFFTAHNLSFDPPITSVCYEWCKINSERWFQLIPYVRLLCIRKILGSQCFAFATVILIKFLFPLISLQILYSYVVNEIQKNLQIIK